MTRALVTIAAVAYLVAAFAPCGAPSAPSGAARVATATAAHAGHTHGASDAANEHTHEHDVAPTFLAALCHCGCHRARTAGAPPALGPALPSATLADAAPPAFAAPILAIADAPTAFAPHIDHVPRPA